MSNEQNVRAFISYLDEKNSSREGYVDIVEFDSSFVKFKTKGNVIIVPTARVLKIKYKEEKEDDGTEWGNL